MHAPVIAGGIIPEDDRPRLLAAGVAAVYTPKDFELTKIMGELADLVNAATRSLSGARADRTMTRWAIRPPDPWQRARAADKSEMFTTRALPAIVAGALRALRHRWP